MKRKIAFLMFLIILAFCGEGVVFGDDLLLSEVVENFYEEVDRSLVDDRDNPALPLVDRVEESGAFDPVLYRNSDLNEIDRAVENMLSIYTVYSDFVDTYPDEFSFITAKIVFIMEIIAEKAEKYKDESPEGRDLIWEGLGQVIEACVSLFTAPDLLSAENRLEIATATLFVAGRKWEFIPGEKKEVILPALFDYYEIEDVEEIKELVFDFLKGIISEDAPEEKARI